MDEMEMLVPEEEEEMVELMEKRSGLTLPTPNVEDAGMLMGMGKRSLRYHHISGKYSFLINICFLLTQSHRASGSNKFVPEGGLGR